MLKLIFALIVNALALLVTAYIVPGFEIASYQTAAVAAIVIGVINTFVKPVVQLIALPITILSLGLFSIIINLALLYFASHLVPGFVIDGVVSLILGSIVLSLVSSFLGMFK